MRATSIAGAIALALLLGGCLKPIPVWREWQFTRSQPAEEDVVATWRPTAETLREIRNRGGYLMAEPELILREDHTFIMRNMPDWWRDGFGKSHGTLESGDGKWNLASEDHVWVIRLHFPTLGTSVHLYRRHSPYLIFIRIGDPDTGDAMFFERSTA
jgi:hypothetical protein